MIAAVDTRVLDERAARADLRAQIAALEARGVRVPSAGGPRLLSLGELERVRDGLAARPEPAEDHEAARVRLERMLADPPAHRWERVSLAALGEPGCGVYAVRPRLGLIGILAGWWQVKLSSGCPLAMRRGLVVMAILAIAGPSPALSRSVAFSGSCALSGTVSFEPFLTVAPQDVTQRAYATGTCSGTLNGRRISGAPVSYAARSEAPGGSCLAGTASGHGALAFPGGRLRFRMSETRLAAFPLLVLSGARSGSATAAVTPSPEQDPVATLQACSGDGLPEFSFDGRLQTTPRIAG